MMRQTAQEKWSILDSELSIGHLATPAYANISGDVSGDTRGTGQDVHMYRINRIDDDSQRD